MNTYGRNTLCLMLLMGKSIICMTQQEARQNIFSPNTEDVKAAIEADPQVVHTQDEHKRSPLHVHSESISTIPRYTQPYSLRGYDITMFPNTAPQDAEIENLQLILQNGGNPNVQDAHGNTAMHEAADIGRCAAFELLFQYGGRIQAKSCQPRKDLEHAIGPPYQSEKDAELGRHDIFKKCLEYGADPRWLSSTASGITPFAIALLHDAREKSWNAKLAELLSPYCAYEDEDPQGNERPKSLRELYVKELKHKRHLNPNQLIEQLKHYACCGLGQSISRHHTFGTEAAEFLESIGKEFKPQPQTFLKGLPLQIYSPISDEKLQTEREDYIIPATLLHAEILRSFNTQSSFSSENPFLPALVNIAEEIQLNHKTQAQMKTFVDMITSRNTQSRINKMLKMAATRVNNHTLSLPAFRHILLTYQHHITNEFDNIPDESIIHVTIMKT